MISIIVPTYNRSHLISRAINSVLKQDFSNWELIIVDDGSSDNTEEIVNKFLKDPRIKYLRKSNTGATHTRNVGVQHSNGEYITFLDSDDEAYPNWLSLFSEELNNGYEVVCCGYRYYNSKGDFIKENLPYNMGGLYGNRIGRFTNGGVFIIKKSYFLEAGGYDEDLKSGQHSEMAIRLFEILDRRKIEIKNIYRALIKVHVHDGPKIRMNNEAIYLGSIRTMEKHNSLFLKNKELYADYLSVAAVSAIRTNRTIEAKKLFLKASRMKSFSIKSYLRYFLCFIPFVREYIWKQP